MQGTEGPGALGEKLNALRATLEALPLTIEDVRVRTTEVVLASYPDGPRPTSTIEIRGGGFTAFGEHVGWTGAEHTAFGVAASGVARGAVNLGDWARNLAALPAYDRAALEAAALDLALRQGATNLFELAGVEPRPVRYIVSFAPTGDPVAEAGLLGDGRVELKIDADPTWNEATWKRIGALGRVAVVDFKNGGDPDAHWSACSAVKDAWIEDPAPGAAAWSPVLVQRLSADGIVLSVAALETMSPQPAAVNVKAPRMGGVLEAIDCLAVCASRGLHAYIGGMFEVGIGRRQSLVLAALACPDGPNDIAPLTQDVAVAPRSASDRTTARLELAAGLAGFAGDPPR